jgi:hypothetical protein
MDDAEIIFSVSSGFSVKETPPIKLTTLSLFFIALTNLFIFCTSINAENVYIRCFAPLRDNQFDVDVTGYTASALYISVNIKSNKITRASADQSYRGLATIQESNLRPFGQPM